jgi:hypothetical protein
MFSVRYLVWEPSLRYTSRRLIEGMALRMLYEPGGRPSNQYLVKQKAKYKATEKYGYFFG